jgi:hypothetical protein
MTKDQARLEEFLNNLKGEVIAVVPSIHIVFFWTHRVNFILIVEKVCYLILKSTIKRASRFQPDPVPFVRAGRYFSRSKLEEV